MKRSATNQQAVALLLTLAFVVIITIIIVAFTSSMRLDRPAAASYFEKMRAAQFAQTGVETVNATLHQYAAIVSGTGNNNWISEPGQLIVSASTSNALTTVVPLYSGSISTTGTASDPILQPPNLNVPMFRDQYNLISDGTAPLPMTVSWIYVRKSGAPVSGTQSGLTLQSLTSGTDPIVGRYAYWADDESGKINYNIAWRRGGSNTNPPSDLTNVDLTVLPGLTGTQADAMRSALLSPLGLLSGPALMGSGINQLYYFFNTPEDARRVDSISPGVAAALGNNQFEVTNYSHDPDTTFFNQPRIVLTTIPSRAGWTLNSSGVWVGGKPFLNIFGNSPVIQPGQTLPGGPYDVGLQGNLDLPTLTATIYFLMSYLQRTDWPMVSGSGSFQSKYFPVGAGTTGYPTSQVSSDRLAQLAIDIIDYVRSKESQLPLVQPIRVSHGAQTYPVIFNTSSTFPGFVPVSTLQPFTSATAGSNYFSYMGSARGLRVTELAIWSGSASLQPYKYFQNGAPISSSTSVTVFQTELYLPKNFGLPSIDLTTLTMRLGNTGMNLVGQQPEEAMISGSECSPSSTLYSGSYVTVTRVEPQPAGKQLAGVAIGTPPLGTDAYGGPIGGARVEIAPLVSGTATNSAIVLNCPAPAPGTPLAKENSWEVDDPRVNKSVADWKLNTTGNTFGQQNSIYSVGTAASNARVKPLGLADGYSGPQLDTDSSGNISDASLYMPPPAGATFKLFNGTVDDNTKGVVQSVGELGYVCTGIESMSVYGNDQPLPPGIPWRTFRLQPNNEPASEVPDWALMDLFTVPVTTNSNAQYIYTPHDASVGGRVNINSTVVPFTLNRVLPLTAVLQGCESYADATTTGTLSTTAAAQAIAQNIVNGTLATINNGAFTARGKKYGSLPSYNYHSPGEVVEIAGVADKGEGSEALVRNISNLITARGDVYTAYSIGQALQQTPQGNLVVTGEQRLQATLERYVSTNVTTGSSTVTFRPVYFRNLIP
jgi:hypothetical protein